MKSSALIFTNNIQSLSKCLFHYFNCLFFLALAAEVSWFSFYWFIGLSSKHYSIEILLLSNQWETFSTNIFRIYHFLLRVFTNQMRLKQRVTWNWTLPNQRVEKWIWYRTFDPKKIPKKMRILNKESDVWLDGKTC